MLIHRAVFLFLELMKFSGTALEYSSMKFHFQSSAFHTDNPKAGDLQECQKKKQGFRDVSGSFLSLKSSRNKNKVISHLLLVLSQSSNNREALFKASVSPILQANPNTEARSNLIKQTSTKSGFKHFSSCLKTDEQILSED